MNAYQYTKSLEYRENGTLIHGCLYFNKPTHVNNGNYTLLVWNELGRDSKSVYSTFMYNPFNFNPEEPIPGEKVLQFSRPNSEQNITNPKMYYRYVFILITSLTGRVDHDHHPNHGQKDVNTSPNYLDSF